MANPFAYVPEALEPRLLLAAVLVRDLSDAATSGISSAIAVGNKMFFAADDGSHGAELWVSDGTPGGTSLVKDIWPGPDGSNDGSNIVLVGALNGSLIFSASDATSQGLWRSDGSETGTTLLMRRVSPTVPYPGTSNFFVLNGIGYFLVGATLWRTDGTVDGTRSVDSTRRYGPYMAQMGNYLYFNGDDSHGSELWRTDGSPTGATFVKDIYPGQTSGYPYQFAVAGNTLFFAANSPSGYELWKSDGTAAGTTMVRDIIPGSAPIYIQDSPHDLTSIGGNVVFQVPADGNSLWRSDGTSEGTYRIVDGPSFRVDLLANGALDKTDSAVYFRATVAGKTALWKTDGTAAGTGSILAFDPDVDVIDNASTVGQAYFFRYVHGDARELRKSEGADLSTSLVTDDYQDVGPALGQFTDKILLTLDDGRGLEPWQFDSSTGEFNLIKDINPPSFDSEPRQIVNVNGTLFFNALHQLWRSDGTAAGTRLVAQITPALTPNGPSVGPTNFDNAINLNGVYLFSNYNELWRSDGTPGGTRRIAQYVVRPLTNAYVFNNVVYSSAYTGPGWDLWRSDGTTAGTYRLKQISSAALDFGPSGFVPFKGALYFVGGPSGKTSLWKTDGTSTGTIKVQNAMPIPPVVFKDKLYFDGCDSSGGSCRLWSTDGTSPGAPSDIGPAGSVADFFTVSNGDLLFPFKRSPGWDAALGERWNCRWQPQSKVNLSRRPKHRLPQPDRCQRHCLLQNGFSALENRRDSGGNCTGACAGSGCSISIYVCRGPVVLSRREFLQRILEERRDSGRYSNVSESPAANRRGLRKTGFGQHGSGPLRPRHQPFRGHRAVQNLRSDTACPGALRPGGGSQRSNRCESFFRLGSYRITVFPLGSGQ